MIWNSSQAWQDNWEKTKERLLGAWTLKDADRPCINIRAPKAGASYKTYSAPATPDEYRRWYTDPDVLYERASDQVKNSVYLGEAYPVLFSNFGTAGHAKYFAGCHYEFSRDTVWFYHTLDDWDTFRLEENPSVLEEEKRIMAAVAERSLGEFFVSMPDNCGVLDALEHLRGNLNLLYDLLDYPERVKETCHGITQVLKRATAEIYQLLKENNDGGSVHGWMNTFADGSSLQLQADFSVMISPEDYAEFVMPELKEMTEFLDYSVYHLDGQEQIRHLDQILSLPDLNMIQWTPVVGQPPVTEFIPVLRRIQDAGKGLVLFAGANEIERLTTELAPEGVILNVNGGIATEADARDLYECFLRWSGC